MDKKYAKYMKYGKLVEDPKTKKVYMLVENMREDKDVVMAVDMDNCNRYERLSAWIDNWQSNNYGFRERFTEDIAAIKAEHKSYEETIKIEDVIPHNEIRFITSSYKTLFFVKDLSAVLINGVEARVAYNDDYHFTFIDRVGMHLYGGCFHICQFAEICEQQGYEVKPAETA